MKDNFWVEESSGKPSVSKKRKRRVGKRKIEFIGWGSRPLIEFLEAIGQDTSKKHSRHDVAAYISKYINEKGLASAEKKKKVLCDERLHALFAKKSLSRIKVYDMLEEHFVENHDDSDDELLDSSEEEDYGGKRSLGLKIGPSGQMKKVPKTPKSCFAAIIPENIKLVYLKKSVIQELLKVPESFEYKILGSFVRMKSDPNDIYQKNRFQLQLVTGVEKVLGGGDAGIEICLKVSNFFKDVPISMLSDDNFTEEEIEDVRERVKAGLLKRLTVNELELKAQTLHADITKHWIAKEISLLHKLIDHANEKGWRRELFEYLERRKTLQTPSEQEKLLLNIPEVIAEELDPEGTAADASEKAEGSARSPKSILRGSSDVSSTDASGHEHVNESSKQVKETGDQHNDFIGQGTRTADVIGEERDVMSHKEGDPQQKPEQPIGTTHVIELSDDEQEDDNPKSKDQTTMESPDDVIWHYADPQGQTQGPFSLYLLKRWNDSNYFHSAFTVWKSGQTPFDAVLLVDLLRRTFPCS
ncbi:uncharacterized protein At5g08430 [Sesamum indicum]|uniref:Uncharacterized protein At5g08430 n=1 Tax=Sesamum indicum TaxID=4182 RepID=A0A6I9TUL4_SESIN|nr:uncharacterized protein At5g08430 [Sesamum indicum]XP_011087415.1 uncharacterized protein At5g08430 [Sesamum indicum]XP_020552716.1 uncharacterized protein At5g08430 [Sesamum indicum]